MCADYQREEQQRATPGRAVPTLRFGSADSALDRSPVIASMTRASALNLITPVVVCSRSEIMAAPLRRQASAERIVGVRSPDALQVNALRRSNSSRRSSRSSSNRGSFYSEGSNELELFGSREACDEQENSESSDADNEFNEEDAARKELAINECSSCKEESRVQQALSVQQARQR